MLIFQASGYSDISSEENIPFLPLDETEMGFVEMDDNWNLPITTFNPFQCEFSPLEVENALEMVSPVHV